MIILHVVATLTSFNRKDRTLSALQRLAAAGEHAGVRLSAVLVDDGSTDGTAQAVSERFGWVRVLRGDGSLYWARGMHRAMQAAQALGDADCILWLNDDTELHHDALLRLLSEADAIRQRLGRPPIMVGATRDDAGNLTYGGDVVESRWRRFQYRRIGGLAAPSPCDAMNGNCVLIPIEVFRSVGNIDPAFEHAMGDSDYALRARASGVPVYVASGFVGTCSHNTTTGTFQDRSLSFRKRWRAIMHRKGLPWRSWLRFTRRHGGIAWPAYFVWPYARLVIDSLTRAG